MPRRRAILALAEHDTWEICILQGTSIEGAKKLKAFRKEFDKYDIYGTSGSTVRALVTELGPGTPQKSYIHTQCCGEVRAGTALRYEGGSCDCYGGTGGDTGGEGLCFCLVLIAALMVVVTIVWAVVMIVFSIVTIGGFVRRRYRTALLVERSDSTFIGRLAIAIASLDGVMDVRLGIPEYDEWVKGTVRLFKFLKYIRQTSLFLGFIWGGTEVFFKLRNVFDPTYHYDLWPFRIVMIIIFIPLILSTPVLEIKFRGAFSMSEDIIQQIIVTHPEYRPSILGYAVDDLQRFIDDTSGISNQ